MILACCFRDRLRILIALLCMSLLFSLGCSSADQLLNASGVRQAVYREKTDLLFTELYYPITNNTNLDSILRERILNKYRKFYEQLNENSIKLLNNGTAFTYKATFDVLRSQELRIISFILYETWEVQSGEDGDAGTAVGNRKRGPLVSDLRVLQREGGKNSTTSAEVLMYSFRYNSVVDFLDVIEQPLMVFEGLARSCLRQLNEHVGTGEFYSQGIKPDRQHLGMLSIGKSGIQVSFPPGQVLPSDQGVINVMVPWAEGIPKSPWQFGITRIFRPLAYQSRKKADEAASSPAYFRDGEALR